MCGIAALISTGEPLEPELIARMTQAVQHRGPDGSGRLFFHSTSGTLKPSSRPVEHTRVALGHRRLSILDLSEAGAQPMSYRDTLHITYNGEVYNYIELRGELEALGHTFRSHSDTEVILAAYAEWGTSAFERLRGMWGLVLLDTASGEVVLSRDRLGIKPLYVLETPDLIAVASEPKQFLCLPSARLAPDAASVSSYLLTSYERPDRSFFEGVRPLVPGTFQVYSLTRKRFDEPRSYWAPERIRQERISASEAGQRFRVAFEDAVRVHMRSDVPVGCALSGGLDSSAVAACAQRTLGGASAIQTFSVTFPGADIDERRYMEIVARAIGSREHYTTPTADDFTNELDDFLRAHDEPVGSFSQYAGYRVARLTREGGVPVTLNGQGGDEVFSAYWQCYFVYLNSLARPTRWPTLARELIGAARSRGNPELYRQVMPMARRVASRLRPMRTLQLVNGYAQDADVANPIKTVLGLDDVERRLFDVRALTLPRLLKWDDRNFMAFSVEGRYPFLDHPLIELCLSFPRTALYQDGWTKEPLRRGLNDVLPQAIVRRKTKLGFETPREYWLSERLRAAVRQFVSSDSPAWKYVNPASARELARRVWDGGGTREQTEALFRVFMVDRWLRLYNLA